MCNLVLVSTSKFYKATKLYKPIGWLEFEVFENLTSAYLHQIAHEIMLLLVNNLQVKCIT